MPKDPRAAAIVLACDALIPIARAAKQLLRRKRMSAAELARAVPGLVSWCEQHDFGATPMDVAVALATGKNPFAIVQWLSGTRRTSEQVQLLYTRWRMQQPRAKRA
jgi:hypothetical protein